MCLRRSRPPLLVLRLDRVDQVPFSAQRPSPRSSTTHSNSSDPQTNDARQFAPARVSSLHTSHGIHSSHHDRSRLHGAGAALAPQTRSPPAGSPTTTRGAAAGPPCPPEQFPHVEQLPSASWFVVDVHEGGLVQPQFPPAFHLPSRAAPPGLAGLTPSSRPARSRPGASPGRGGRRRPARPPGTAAGARARARRPARRRGGPSSLASTVTMLRHAVLISAAVCSIQFRPQAHGVPPPPAEAAAPSGPGSLSTAHGPASARSCCRSRRRLPCG